MLERLRVLRFACLVLALFVGSRNRLAFADAHLFADLNPGPPGSGPGPFVQVGSGAFFRAATGDGYELWHTDGTPAGTAEVLDINPGPASADPRSLTPASGKLFFVAAEPVGGTQVWVSDATAAGTQRLSAIVPPVSYTPDPGDLTASGGLVYFVAQASVLGSMIWATDGTVGGTEPLATFGGVRPTSLVDFGGTLYFAGGDPLAPDGDRELWRSDGTAAGTMRAVDVLPGPQGSRPLDLVVSNGVLYFFAHAAGGEPELWRSLGTLATTTRLATFPIVQRVVCHYGFPPVCEPYTLEPGSIQTAGGRIFFEVYHSDGPHLWTSDGTVAGTIALAAITPLSYEIPPFSYVTEEAAFTTVGGAAFFRGAGTELWTSDGTLGGTGPVGASGGPAPTRVIQLTPSGGLLYFVGGDVMHGPELWRSDGTAAGTIRLTNGPDTTDDTIFAPLVDVDGTLYFGQHDPAEATVLDNFGGYEPWKSDGTPGGTVQLAEIVPGPIGSSPQNFARVNGTLLFAATQPCFAQGWEPFTDGPGATAACGNGALDSGEQCDLGGGNGAADTCCKCDCTFRGFDNLFCRMPGGGCDGGGVCNGTSATCPAPVPPAHCGDGVLDPGEQCDPAGPSGGVCCTSCCQFALPGLVCRFSTASCDPAERCTGASGACPDDQNCGPDLCTNPVPGNLFKANLRLRLVAAQTLTLSGKLALSTVDPTTHGLRVLVSGANDVAIADVQAAAGTGWKLVGTRGWSYKNTTAGPGQIDRARLIRSASSSLLALRVHARPVLSAVSTQSVPVEVTVLVDATAQTTQCGEMSLARCRLSAKSFSCR
jgi:ELWxxDGT repeat protein